jgi:hypothetical protein
MNAHLNHQVAQARHADQLRTAEKHRLGEPTGRRTVLSLLAARLPRITAGARQRLVALHSTESVVWEDIDTAASPRT